MRKIATAQEKVALLGEIQRALDESRTRSPQSPKYREFSWRGITTYRILNKPEVLVQWKKLVESHFPIREGRAPRTSKAPRQCPSTSLPTNRLRGIDVEYYNAFSIRPRRSPALPLTDHPPVWYWEGWFVTNHYMVKLSPRPKLPARTPDYTEEGIPIGGIKRLIHTQPTGSTLTLVGEFKLEDAEEPTAHAIGSEGVHVFLNPEYLDFILTAYPDATLHWHPDESRVSFYQGGKLIGLMGELKWSEEKRQEALALWEEWKAR